MKTKFLIMVALAASVVMGYTVDNFTDVDGTTLGAHDANWAVVSGSSLNNLLIQDNTLRRKEYTATYVYYNTSTSDTSEVLVLATGNANRQVGPGVRMSGTTRGYNCYLSGISGGNWTSIVINENSSFKSGITSLSIDTLSNQVLRIVASGSGPVLLKFYINSTQVGSYTDNDGTYLTTGSPGLCSGGSDAGNFVLLDDWKDGNGPMPPSIVTQPISVSALEDRNVSFSVVANGDNLSYIAYRNEDSVGNSNIYRFFATSSNNNDSVWFKVTNSEGFVLSNKAYLTISDTTWQTQLYTDSVYNKHSKFKFDRYGEDKDSLYFIYRGVDISTDTVALDTLWEKYISVNSMSLISATILPTRAYMQWGLTTSYTDSSTNSDTCYYFTHLVRADSLTANTVYHYRMVYKNRYGDEYRTQDSTFTTTTMSGKTQITGLGPGTVILSESNKYYILTDDADYDSVGIIVTGSYDTIDLNGHNISYHNIRLGTIQTTEWHQYSGWYGVRASVYGRGIVIVNGTISEGKGIDSCLATGNGFAPIGGAGYRFNISFITAKYWSTQASGLSMANVDSSSFCYNEITDYGWQTVNRHAIHGAIRTTKSDTCNWNLIKRTRHAGIAYARQVHNNEIYQNSYYTNGFAVYEFGAEDGTPMSYVTGNKIFLTGYHSIGIGTRSRMWVRDNFIHGEGTAPYSEGGEYGAQSSLIGIRLTQYLNSHDRYDSLTYRKNIITLHGRDTCQMRGLQLSSDTCITFTVDSNKIKVVRDDYTLYDYIPPGTSNSQGNMACVVTHGVRDTTNNLSIYKNNTFISNYCFIRFGDYYERTSVDNLFLNDTFVKQQYLSDGDHPFANICTYAYMNFHNFNQRIVNPVIVGGFEFDTMNFNHSQPINSECYNGKYLVGYRIVIKTDAGREIKIIDYRDSVHYDKTAAGSDTFDVFRYQQNTFESLGKNIYEPFTIISIDGEDTLKELNYYPSLNDTIDLSGNVPITITVQPQNMTFPFGVYADTFIYVTSNAVHYKWNINGSYYVTDNDTLTFEVNPGWDGWQGFVKCWSVGGDTVTSNTFTFNEGGAPQVCVTPSIDSLSDTLTYTGNTITVYGTDFTDVTAAILNNREQVFIAFDDSVSVTWTNIVGPGTYDFWLTNSCGDNSDTVQVTILAPGTPIIVSQPQSITLPVGSNAIFTVAATGDGVLYKGYVNGDSVSPVPVVMIENITVDNDGDKIWFKAYTGSGDTVFSDTAILTIYQSPITITTQPRDTAIVNRGLVNFAITATGVDSFHYQWIINSQPYGTDQNSVSFTADTSHDSSLIYCKVWSAGGDTVVSDTALLRVWTPFRIDSLGIGAGPYVKGSIPHTVDSVYCDGEKATIVGQDATHVEFTPASVLMWSRTAYPVIFYYIGGTYEFDLKLLNKFGSTGNNKTRISLDIGL